MEKQQITKLTTNTKLQSKNDINDKVWCYFYFYALLQNHCSSWLSQEPATAPKRKNTYHICHHLIATWYNFEDCRHEKDGVEYTKWSNFKQVIEKAKISCEGSKQKVSYHFADVGKTIKFIYLLPLIFVFGCIQLFDIELKDTSIYEKKSEFGKEKSKHLMLEFQTNKCLEDVDRFWQFRCFLKYKNDVIDEKSIEGGDFLGKIVNLENVNEQELNSPPYVTTDCINSPYMYKATLYDNFYDIEKLSFLQDDSFELLSCYAVGVTKSPRTYPKSNNISVLKETLKKLLQNKD